MPHLYERLEHGGMIGASAHGLACDVDFKNLCGLYVEDDREDNRTDPPTLAFVAPTNEDRLLKVCFMFINGNVHIKTAFDASPSDIAYYDKHGK